MAMDFISGPTTVATTTPRTPDSDTDTPPHPPPAKRSHLHHHHNNHQQQHVSYKECLKNHAASIGGHALDGCCEFMPGPTANLLDPTSLTCAACGCHRNFHRRDPDDPTPLHHLIPTARRPHSPPTASQLLLSLSGHANSPSAPSDHEILQTPTNHPITGASSGGGGGGGVITGYYNSNTTTNGGSGGQNGNLTFQNKKRFRTKFSQEQKDKMHEFSEKIGWKLKKGEERLVEEFCQQVGVDRSVFKVWMHNNKHSSTSSSANATVTATATATTSTTSIISTNGNHENNNNDININTNTNVVGVGVGVGGLNNNCGGVLGAATTGLEFNFANGVGQEAKAQ